MRDMDDSKEVKRLMHALIPHIKQAKHFKAQDIAMALYGLQNQTCSDQSERILSVIDDAVPNISSDSLLDTTEANQGLAESINSLQNHFGETAAAALLTYGLQQR